LPNSTRCPDEYEPLTFCVRTLKELRGLQVKTIALVSKNGQRIAAPAVQIVRCVPRLLRGEEPLYEDGPVGVMNMPAYLEPARLLDVAAGRTVQFWLTIKTDKDTAPGIYMGEIQILQEQGKPHRVGVMLEVLPIQLTDPPHVLGFWDFQRPYQGEIGPLDEVYRIMNRHGINAVFTRAGLYEYQKDTDTYDFSKTISIDEAGHATVSLDGSPMEKQMEAAKRAGLTHVVYQPHHWIFVAEEVQRRQGRAVLEEQCNAEIERVLRRYEMSEHYDLIKDETPNSGQTFFPMYSQDYATLYMQILREILAEVESRGWPKLLVDPGDETYSHHVHNRISFPYVVRHLELMKLAGATTILNHISPDMGGEYGEYVRDALRFLDIGMPGLRLSNPSPYRSTIEKTAQDFTALGLKTFTYSNSGQAAVKPDLSVARFSAGFFFHTVGRDVRGVIDYIFYRPERDAYNPADVPRLWSHERLWFFPPQEEDGRLGGRALALAAKREGFDDLRYLETLDGLIEQAESRTNDPNVQQVAHAANAIRKRILDSCDFTEKALDTNGRNLDSRWDELIASPDEVPIVKGKFRLHNGWDFATYDRHRRVIAEVIMKLQKVLISTEANQ